MNYDILAFAVNNLSWS